MITELMELLQTNFWWATPIFLLLYITEKFGISNWLIGRNKEKQALITLISAQLKEEDISPQMRNQLKIKREQLLLEITERIFVPQHLVMPLLASLEDKLNGIEWYTLRHAREHFSLDRHGELTIFISIPQWVLAIAMLFPAIVCFGFSLAFGWLGINASDPRVVFGGLAFAAIFALSTPLFLQSLRNIVAAKKVTRFLKRQDPLPEAGIPLLKEQ